MRSRGRILCCLVVLKLIGRIGLRRERKDRRNSREGLVCVAVPPRFAWRDGRRRPSPRGLSVLLAVNFQREIHFAYSFFTTSPPFITNFTRWSVVTSFSGSPSTATMSAQAPGSNVPTLPDQPSRSAALMVEA